jgi:hypothetical protein
MDGMSRSNNSALSLLLALAEYLIRTVGVGVAGLRMWSVVA